MLISFAYQQSKWNKSQALDLGETDNSDVRPERVAIRCGERYHHAHPCLSVPLVLYLILYSPIRFRRPPI